MKASFKRATLYLLLLALIALTGCAARQAGGSGETGMEVDAPDTSRYIVAVEEVPDTVDFQCTTIFYTIATNVFDRLVEMEDDDSGHVVVKPSLAESWEVSEDGCRYTFHLREGVRFSNGSPLTASDVLYTFTRLLTHRGTCNRDIAEGIVGALALEKGEADTLSGFEILSELDFAITLTEPFEAFLACLSMPGASIMDEETTQPVDDRFGLDPACTIGTGPFILKEWNAGEGFILVANPDCWWGAPKCDGLDLRFLSEAETIRAMFDRGELDILELEDIGNAAEYYMHGDIYQNRLIQVRRLGTVYIALNASVAPLHNVSVRKALQYALNRVALLDAVYAGRGSLENGIFPHGLYGFNPDLPEIPYDVEAARALMESAGLTDGFDLIVSVKSSSSQWEMTLMKLAVKMWAEIGVRATIDVIDEATFMHKRKHGLLSCYTAAWTADFDDPDNFIYTFFGNRENTKFRSLCYRREDIMARVRAARAISDPEARLREYHELEEIIVQRDAAWIPLFSRLRYYVISERLHGVHATWNGSIKNNYRYMSVD